MSSFKNTVIDSTDAIKLPVGTTAQRPASPSAGQIRYNSSTNCVEHYDGLYWRYNPDIIRDSLKLHLDAAEPSSYSGTGNIWYDISGSNNHGTLNNSPTYLTSNGGCFSFDGVNDYVNNNSTFGLPLGLSDRTVCMWVNFTTYYNVFVQMGNTVAGQSYIVNLYNHNSAGIFYVFTDGRNSPNNFAITPSESPPLNTWNYIIFQNIGQKFILSINGRIYRIGTWSVAINTTSQRYNIGYRDDSPVNYFQGKIASVSIYERALSKFEINQNFNALRGRFNV